MPKDCIHFTIAEKTARRLADTQYAAPLDHARDTLLLGSVFHDALFYAATRAGRPLERLAHTLHGADGQDTFTLVRLQGHHAAQTNSPEAIAMLVGIISHLYADAVMHPLVWHLTGDYYAEDPATRSMTRQRHRALESLMDMVACPDKLRAPTYSLRRMLQARRTPWDAILPLTQLGEIADVSARTTHRELTTAWRIYAALQAAYGMRPLARMAGAVRRWLPDTLAEIAALFYMPQLLNQAAPLTGRITYRHPVTGAELSSTLDDLMDTAARQSAKLCIRIAPAVFGDEPFTLDAVGPSMDAGLSETPTSEMRHFARPPFPDLG